MANAGSNTYSACIGADIISPASAKATGEASQPPQWLRDWQDYLLSGVVTGEMVMPSGCAGTGAGVTFFESASRLRNNVSTKPGMLFSGLQPRRNTDSRTLRRPNCSASLQLHRYRSTLRPRTAGPVSITVHTPL